MTLLLDVNQLMNRHVFVDKTETPSSDGLEILSETDEYTFYWWKGGQTPLPLGEVTDLIEDSWMHDYGHSNQARFKYTQDYINWYTQGDTCDGILVRAKTGELAAFLATSKRVLHHKDELIPILYAALLAVALPHRKKGLSAAINDLMIDVVLRRYGTMYFGALDGKAKADAFEAGVIDSRKKRNRRGQVLLSHTRALPFWAATNDLKKLLDYMPLTDNLNKIALTRPVRKLVEFRYREPRHKDYALSLVTPGCSTPVSTPSGAGFVFNETLAALYSSERPDIAGTYRVDFNSGRYCQFSYVRQVASKLGLPDAICAQIQIIDHGTANRREVARALKIVTNEFFKTGCFAVLRQNWTNIPALDLLRTRFVPSDRKIGFKTLSLLDQKSETLDLQSEIHFDLI